MSPLVGNTRHGAKTHLIRRGRLAWCGRRMLGAYALPLLPAPLFRCRACEALAAKARA